MRLAARERQAGDRDEEEGGAGGPAPGLAARRVVRRAAGEDREVGLRLVVAAEVQPGALAVEGVDRPDAPVVVAGLERQRQRGRRAGREVARHGLGAAEGRLA